MKELKVSKITVTVLGVIAIILEILFENQGIAPLWWAGICYRREAATSPSFCFPCTGQNDHARRYAGRLVEVTDSGGADDSWPTIWVQISAAKKRSSVWYPARCSAPISVLVLRIWFSLGRNNSAKATVNVSSSRSVYPLPKRVRRTTGRAHCLTVFSGPVRRKIQKAITLATSGAASTITTPDSIIADWH